MSGACCVGVDIGGTKIAAALIDADDRVIRRGSVPTPRGAAGPVLRSIADLVTRLSDGADVMAVGVGSPGVVDPATGAVLSATGILPGWAGTQVRAELESRLGRPVAAENDVHVMAHGEARCGAGRDVRDVWYVSVGTGVGGALQRDGRLLPGRRGTVGALAHLLVPARGVIACGCGRYDHLESMVAGPAIAATYAAAAGACPLALPDVVARMRSGDAQAAQAITGAGALLGRALAGLLAAVDADVVVLGGGVVQLGPEFLTSVTAALRAEALPALGDVAIRAAQLGTDAPLIGAAGLARDLIGAAS